MRLRALLPGKMEYAYVISKFLSSLTVLLIFQITELCLEFICFDPNYNYGSDDEDENSMDTDDQDDEEG